MYINEYGDPSNPAVIMLSPMLISGSDIYGLMTPYLKGEYFIIAPDQGGHGKAGNYVSAAEEYRELKKYLLQSGHTEIKLLYGASLGVAVGWRLFFDPDINAEHVWFDGVALTKSSMIMEQIMKQTFMKKKKELDRTHMDSSDSLTKMYGEYFSKLMIKNLERVTPRDIDAICYACCHYDLKPLSDEQQQKLHLEYGEEDFDLNASRKAFKQYLPKVKVVIRKGYPHCGYMAAHTKEYVEEIENFM
ncbi:MAG: hypothetical protein K6E33_06185 [Lachnospiraceae bacterium]|nr:hypothetical protein [Lachnospiraceae bacterium]